MYSFGKGYRKRIYFLCAISCFFALLGVVYAYIYKELMDLIMQQYQVIINFLVEKIPLLQNSSFFDKVAVLAGMLPTWILWIVGAYLLYKIIAYCYSLFMKFFTLLPFARPEPGIQRRVYAHRLGERLAFADGVPRGRPCQPRGERFGDDLVLCA